jgi:hypothetical protein
MSHTTDRLTAKIKLTPFQAYIADGSDISRPDIDSGYQRALACELHRIGPNGGTIELDAAGFDDLGEFASDLANAVAQDPNPSGAQSLEALSRVCAAQARVLRKVVGG